MSQPELRATLLEDDDIDAQVPDLSDEDRFLLRRFAAAGALLLSQPDLYRDLLERRRDEGDSEEVQAIAHDAAEQAATVLQSARERQDLLVAAQSTPMNPTRALAALDQLFLSFTLLSSPEDELNEAVLDEEGLEDMLELLEVRAWLEQIGAST